MEAPTLFPISTVSPTTSEDCDPTAGVREWVEPGWASTPGLRASVAALLDLDPGPELLTAVTAAEGDLVAGRCPVDHGWDLNGGVGFPGSPCICMVICTAAWTAFASWTQHQADTNLVATVGALPYRAAHADKPGHPAEPMSDSSSSSDAGRRSGPVDPGVEDLAIGMRCAPGSLHSRVARVRRRHRHPRLVALVAAGRWAGWQVDYLLDDLAGYPVEVVDAVIDAVVDRIRERTARGMGSWTLPRIRAFARRQAASIDPVTLNEARVRARAQRGVRFRSHGDGSATITATLTDDTASRINNRLSALAHGLADHDGDAGAGRSFAHRRADVFTDLLLDAPHRSPGSGPDDGSAHPGRGEEVAVVITMDALLGLAQTPAQLPGGSPVPVEVARELAADRRWRAWITTTDGTVIATSPSTYRPTAALARLIRAREPYCRMPGCRSGATDLDHTIPFPHGPTEAENLGALCRRHHNLKTHHSWRLVNNPDHTYTWTTPSGARLTDSPDTD
ncbi:MAG: DUF222 domain-containing protein [Candidatus Nanopelagicales bacterium]